tara:strand:- start:2432 stop:3436 length:1005 start_codon:yes stop_codon:yes gene_type:complete
VLSNYITRILGSALDKYPKLQEHLVNYKSDSLKIVYYHMVSDTNHKYYFANKSITPENFYEQLLFLKKNFEIISFNEAFYLIDNKKKLDKKLVLTFDDGFKENYTVIAPILSELNITGAFFFISNCIDNKDLMWRNKLLLLEENITNKSLYETSIRFKIPKIKKNQDLLSWSLNTWPMSKKEEIVNTLCDEYLPYKVEDFLEENSPYCTSEEIKRLYENNFEIGSHSKTHPIFNKLDYESLCHEIISSKEKIENIINDKIQLFSYPFGIRAARDFEKLFLSKNEQIKTLLGIKNNLNNLNSNYNFWERDNLEFPIRVMKFRLLVLPIIRKIWQY